MDRMKKKKKERRRKRGVENVTRVTRGSFPVPLFIQRGLLLDHTSERNKKEKRKEKKGAVGGSRRQGTKSENSTSVFETGKEACIIIIFFL